MKSFFDSLRRSRRAHRREAFPLEEPASKSDKNARPGDAALTSKSTVLDDLPYTQEAMNLPSALTDHGMKSFQEFATSQNIDSLNAAIQSFDEAVQLTPNDDPHLISRVGDLINALNVRYQYLRTSDDLEVAITIARELDEMSQNIGVDWSKFCCGVGVSHFLRYNESGSRDDLDRAINLLSHVISSALIEDPKRGNYLYFLGYASFSRFINTTSLDDWNTAINAFEQVTVVLPIGDPVRELSLNHVNLILQARLERTTNGTLTEWEEAIKATDAVMSSWDDLRRNSFISALAQLKTRRAMETKLPTDLTDALNAVEEAENALPRDHYDQICFQTSKAKIFLVTHERTGSLNDLTASIDALQKALQSCSPTYKSRVWIISILADNCLERGKRTGSLRDLNETIKLLSDEQLASNDPAHLNKLARAFLTRSVWTGSTNDLNASISAWKQSIDLIPEDSPYLANCLSSLGNCFRQRYGRSKDLQDLNDAIIVQWKAKEMSNSTSLQPSLRLYNLGISLWERAKVTGSMQHIDEAIEILDDAVNATPEGDPVCVVGLGIALCTRSKFNAIEDRPDDDLDRAIKLLERAVSMTPKDDPELGNRLLFLGNALQTRFENQNSISDRDAAIASYEQAVASDYTRPRESIISAKRAADLIHSEDPKRARDLFIKAVNLLPQISPRTLFRDDKQAVLAQTQLFSLAIDAATLMIQVTEAESEAKSSSETVFEACRLLEIGRGIIASGYFETRSDLGILKLQHPQLAENLENIRTELNGATRAIDPYSNASDTWPSRMENIYEISKRYDKILDHIRSLDGFQDFQRGLSKSDLKSIASNHPIVYITVSRFGGNAIIITSDEQNVLHLSNLSFEDARQHGNELLNILENRSIVTVKRDVNVMKKILKWLWDVVVEPILEYLGFTETRGDDDIWPRLTWIPAGILSLFPLHAAGCDQNGKTTLDRVISMYSSTLRALVHAKADDKNREKVANSILLAAMPTTPNQSPLPFVTREAELIQAIVPTSVQLTSLIQPTKSEVLECLGKCSIAHFACHGKVESNPSKSHLMLSDWESTLFSVADMTDIGLSGAKLAVLSACNTANTSDYRLLDEAIHMASACQLAGFPTVIGTLWQVQDAYAPTVAEYLYRTIIVGNGTLDISKAAEGLHFAVRKIREESRKFRGARVYDDVFAWAPYIYVGV